MSVGTAVPNGGGASRRRPRDPWRVAASWGAAASWLGLGGNLVSLVWRGCRLGRRVSAEAVGLYVGAAAPDAGLAAMVCGRFVGIAWAAGGRVVRRHSSVASGGMFGWRSRKVVSVVCAGRGGVAGCRGGGPESLAVLWTSISCRVGDKIDLVQFSWRFGLFTLSECPMPAPPIAVMASSLRHGW